MFLIVSDLSESLQNIIKEFWIFENDNSTPNIQKIIPDGFSEIIMHYAGCYLTLLYRWKKNFELFF